MTVEDQTRPAARAALLLERGPLPIARDSWRARVRAAIRSVLLRAVRPHARYQRELDLAIVACLTGLESQLIEVRDRHAEQIERLEDLAREFVLTTESLRRALSSAEVASSWARGTLEPLVAEMYALPYVHDSPFERLSSPVGEVVGFRSATSLPAGESGYVSFEELFRGPAERVTECQRPYVALVREHQPVLDVGCGRGEFLRLLEAEGIAARGIDSDAGMVRRCRQQGLDVTHAEANEYLDGLRDSTLGTVFSAQVIEHLPEPELRHLLELARRKLMPGGLFIAETVNPHRLSSLKTFWVDLTHQHPIFPEAALAACAIAGFESAYVFAPTFDSFEPARFLASSYAIVAAAPSDLETVASHQSHSETS